VQPIVVGPEGGEPVGERVRIVADLDHVAVTQSLYAPGDSGPDPHIHREHADTFYVVGGRLVFELGREAQRFDAPAGTFIGAPPGLVHTFRNEGPEDARFLNFHAPGCRFGRYLRALSAGEDTSWFDSYDPPADGGPPASGALHVPPGEGERTDECVVKAARDELRVEEVAVAPGPARTLSGAADCVRFVAVLEGLLGLDCGDRAIEAGAATCVVLAGGQAITLANPGPGAALLLHVVAPSAA
jgi:mannose-6-phosphate isomerase-like protein (cupin superfamily)